MQDRLRKPKIDFTQVPNDLICSTDISCKAKAVYCYLISRPNDWKFYTIEIVNNMKESRKAIDSALRELIAFGWIEKEQIRIKGKFSHSVYSLFYEVSTVSPKTANHKTANHKTANRKRPTTNTNNTNTNYTNTSKREKEEKRKDMHDFNEFRKNFTKKVLDSKEPFIFNDSFLYFNLDGLMLDTDTNKFLTKSKTFKIWDYLYKNKENFGYEC